MNIEEAFPSKYVKAADLRGGEITVQIASVISEEVGQGDVLPVVYFIGMQKGLVLNRTNAGQISTRHGIETDYWPGAQIILCPAETHFQGKLVPCIRVKLPPVAPQQVAAPTDVVPPQPPQPVSAPPTPPQTNGAVRF